VTDMVWSGYVGGSGASGSDGGVQVRGGKAASSGRPFLWCVAGACHQSSRGRLQGHMGWLAAGALLCMWVRGWHLAQPSQGHAGRGLCRSALAAEGCLGVRKQRCPLYPLVWHTCVASRRGRLPPPRSPRGGVHRDHPMWPHTLCSSGDEGGEACTLAASCCGLGACPATPAGLTCRQLLGDLLASVWRRERFHFPGTQSAAAAAALAPLCPLQCSEHCTLLQVVLQGSTGTSAGGTCLRPECLMA